MPLPRRSLLVSVALCLTITLASLPAHAGNEATYQFNLPEQALAESLRAIARQTGANVLFESKDLKGIKAPALRAQLTTSEAIKHVLAGTTLQAQRTTPTTVIVQPVASGVGAALSGEAGEESILPAPMMVARADVDGEKVQAGSEAAVPPTDDGKQSEVLVVTGTLLRSTPQASSVTVITREDIDRMGLHSAEDIVRSLPQNFSSLNAGSSVNVTGSKDLVRAEDSQGNSGANLRGLGIDATLVLVDGRRLAGSPIFEGGFVNLSTIPAGAIERVEILNDGASAIYGADAVAGVINFILRKDYVGSETSVRYENSSNDGSGYSLTQLLGTSWKAGRATLMLSHDEQDAVSAAKAGWTTQNLTSRGGSDRRSEYTQPGSILRYNFVTGLYDGFSLPSGNDGTNWTPADLVAAQKADLPRKEATSQVRNTSASLRLQQDITESFEIFADTLFSINKTVSESIPLTWGGRVPITNAFNSTGVRELVQYSFIEEARSGLIPEAAPTTNEQQRLSVTAGFNWDLPHRDWRIATYASVAREDSESQLLTLNLGGSGFELPALSGIDANGDPVPVGEQINLFGDGSAQSASLGDYLMARDNGSPDSRLQTWNSMLEGALLPLPGGDIRFAFGGEYRYEQQDYSNNTGRGIDPAGFVYNEETREYEYFADENSVFKPDRTVKAVYSELSVPIFGRNNRVHGVESLMLTAAARWEEYRYDDANSGAGQTFSHVSPKLGLAWRPVADLRIRGTWAESFRAPSFAELIAREDPFIGFPLTLYTGVRDPFFPTEDVTADLIFGGNRNLDPETANTYSFGFDWTPEALQGLSINATYSNIEFNNRITALNYFIHPLDVIFALPSYAERGADGRVVRINAFPVNVAGRESESIDASVNYLFETEAGLFDVGVTAVYTLKLNEILAEGDDPIVLDGTTNGPDTVKSRAALGWSRERAGLNLFVNYSSSYENNNGAFFYDLLREGTSIVGHYVTMDLTGHYELPGSGWRINAGVTNFFDREFPFIDNSEGVPYDSARVDLRGRVIYVDVKKSFNF